MPICQLNRWTLLRTPLHVHELQSISGRLRSLFHELGLALVLRLSIFRNVTLD